MRASKGCVTAFVIGQINSMRVKTDPHRPVADINQQNVQDLTNVPAIAHRIKFEDAARLFYANKYNVDIDSRGFMLHPITLMARSQHRLLHQSDKNWSRNQYPMPVEGKTTVEWVSFTTFLITTLTVE